MSINPKMKKHISFKENFLVVIDVESWKDFNFDVSEIDPEWKKVESSNKSLNNIDLELIENKLGNIISDINKKRFSIKGPLNPENLTKELENEFVPINISENSNLDKIIFTDLTPSYSTDAFEGIYENETEKENNENKNSDNSFSFLSKRK